MHVGFAFHEHHHWSHVAAEAHVAKETAATLGVHWGGGIYFNHALMLVWGIAILRRWTGRFRREPARLIDRVFDLYTALMWLSATIVFGSLGFRVLGAIGFTAIAWAYWVARGRQTLNAAPHVPQSQR